MADVDAIVIGPGHNGLAAAATLAKENIEAVTVFLQKREPDLQGLAKK